MAYWAIEPSTGRLREVEAVTAGTGFNNGDYDFTSPAKYRSPEYHQGPAWRYDPDITDADPGAGFVRFDSATPASITKVIIDGTASESVTMGPTIGSINVGAHIMFHQKGDPSRHLVLRVDSVTNNTTWWTLGVTVYSSGTIFEYNAELAFSHFNVASASGDVVGPGSATDHAVARYDGATGKLLEDSVVIIDDSGNITGVGTLTTSGNVNGRDMGADGTKLDGIESGATADQTGAEIKTAYEAEADTNAYTDLEKLKLAGIENNATADQDDSEIETAYNNQVDVVSQAEAEAGTSTTVRRWTAERVKQAIAALASAGDDVYIGHTTESKSSAYTVTTSDNGKLFYATATMTFTLPAAASAGAGFLVGFQAAASVVVTIDGNASELVDFGLTFTMEDGVGDIWFRCDGSGWERWHSSKAPNIIRLDGLTALADDDYLLAWDDSETRDAKEKRIAASDVRDYMSDYTLLATTTASSDATIDFDTSGWFDGTYKTIVIRAYEIIPATDNVYLTCRVKVGGSWQSSSYTFGRGYGFVSGHGGTGSTSFSGITLYTVLGNNSTTDGAWFTLELYNPASTTRYKGINYQYGHSDFNGNLVSAHGAGRYEGSLGAVQGIRFLVSSGNISSGTFQIYGVK